MEQIFYFFYPRNILLWILLLIGSLALSRVVVVCFLWAFCAASQTTTCQSSNTIFLSVYQSFIPSIYLSSICPCLLFIYIYIYIYIYLTISLYLSFYASFYLYTLLSSIIFTKIFKSIYQKLVYSLSLTHSLSLFLSISLSCC